METPSRVLGGVSVPDTQLVARAIEYLRSLSEPFLFNHAVRSWLFAVRLAQLQTLSYDAEVVAVGSLLHDIGLTRSFDGPRRFEVEGADGASAFASAQGMDAGRAKLIWDCVALNSKPSVALYKEPEVVLCTEGVALDFGGRACERIPGADVAYILDAYPRLQLKRNVSGCLCNIVRAKRFVAGHKPVSTVDLLRDAPLEE